MMRKLLLLSLVVAVGLWAAHGGLIELRPAVGNAPSEYRVVKSPLKPMLHSSMKGSRDIIDANYVIQYEYGDWAYYTTQTLDDTTAVRFISPAKCSLVAFTWCSYCGASGYEGGVLSVFVADTNANANYSTFPGYFNTAYGQTSPLGDILWSGTSTAPGNDTWDTVNFSPVAIDTLTNTFFCGFAVNTSLTDSLGWLVEQYSYSGNPIDVHTYQFDHDVLGPDSGSWFAEYYTEGSYIGTQFAHGIRAYIMAIEDLPPVVNAEELPYSYDTGARKVYVYGEDFTPAGSSVDSLKLFYSVNGGSEQVLTSPTLEDGDLTKGIWSFDIPGIPAGDTVDYYVVGWDPPDPTVLADTSGPFTYEIIAGNPGHFLYVDNGYTISSALPDHYDEGLTGEPSIIDVWDFGAYGGAPDSSVFAFHSTGSDTQKTVIWRDWGAVTLGLNGGYGLANYNPDFPNIDISRCCSTWVKKLLEAGGNFWLSDQDQGYGLGVCPDYGQVSVPVGHWVREYLGIQGMFDDCDSLGGRSLTALDGFNPILGDLFSGSVGYQTAGQIYIAPYAPLTSSWKNYAYTGSFDSLQVVGSQMNMYYLDAGFNAYIISYAYEPPVGGKVYNDFWAFDYICNPADSTEIDEVAVDTLVQDVLGWFGVRSGISDETIEPEKVVKLLPVGLITNEASIRFSLPGRMTVSLDIYDNTGRLVKNLVNGERDGGLHTVRWNARVANGVYFYLLKAGDKTLTDKMVVVK